MVLLLPACKTAKKTTETVVNLKPKPTKYILKKLAANRFEADWFSSKAKINYEDEHEKVKFNANIRMRKDSVIWMNVKKLTVEAARILITPDSFFVIDRMDKKYVARDMAFLERKINFAKNVAPGTSLFTILQEVLLGNPIFLAGKKLESSVEGRDYFLDGEHDDFDSRYQISGTDFLMSLFSFVGTRDRDQNFQVEQEYDGDKEYPNFSYFRSLNVNTSKKSYVNLKIKFSKLEINTPKTIRFEIPKHYTEME